MTTLFQTQNLLWIVPVIVLAGLCYSLWKAGRYREPDKEIYEKELNKKAMKLTNEEKNVLSAMKVRKHWKQAINKIAIDIGMDKEKLREILMSLKDKGYLVNRQGKDGALKWIVRN